MGGGQNIAYTAIAGTIAVGSSDMQDAQLGPDGKPQAGSQLALSAPKEPADTPAVAHMFYVAYFKKDAKPEERPITFFYNGGPGSSTVWLHMGSLGPKHVVTAGDTHLPGAPYTMADNPYSLLDVSDLVFVDMPGTGLRAAGRQRRREVLLGCGRGRERVCALHRTLYYQVRALELAQVYLWRELRHHALRRVGRICCENGHDIDLNGVILLSQIFNFTADIDEPKRQPRRGPALRVSATDFAATAWYHKKLPQQPAGAGTVPERGGGVRAWAPTRTPWPREPT